MSRAARSPVSIEATTAAIETAYPRASLAVYGPGCFLSLSCAQAQSDDKVREFFRREISVFRHLVPAPETELEPSSCSGGSSPISSRKRG